VCSYMRVYWTFQHSDCARVHLDLDQCRVVVIQQ